MGSAFRWFRRTCVCSSLQVLIASSSFGFSPHRLFGRNRRCVFRIACISSWGHQRICRTTSRLRLRDLLWDGLQLEWGCIEGAHYQFVFGSFGWTWDHQEYLYILSLIFAAQSDQAAASPSKWGSSWTAQASVTHTVPRAPSHISLRGR